MVVLPAPARGSGVDLVEIIRGAQAAMDRGDYRLAASACSHVLETFPGCLTAHRMLGESFLEQGATDAAIEHFSKTIETDPLNVVARLGLGVANEEKRRMEEAYTSYLHAWEINPALDQVRDELVRLRGLLNGDERLHPTRSGLAGIYERSGQFGRAAAEWRAVLAADPENARARTAIAEVLWRSGDDAGSAIASRDALAQQPDNARALAILADVESRRGTNVASELAQRYQVLDPAGEIAALLAEWRGEFAMEALKRERVPLTDFDFNAAPVDALAPPPQAGPAAGANLVSSQFAAPDLWDSLVQDLRDDVPVPAPGAPLSDDVQPFSWIDEGASPSADPFSMDALLDTRPAPVAVPAPPVAVAAAAATAPFAAPAGLAATASLEDQIAAMSGQTVPLDRFEPAPVAAVPAAALAATAPFAFDDISAALGSAPARQPDPVLTAALAPEPLPAVPVVPPQPAPAKPAAPAPNPFVTADGRVDLTAGWDDLDRQLREATPSFDNNHEVDALAAELGVVGLMPFDLGESGFDDSAWAPFTDDDLGAPAAPAAAQAPRQAPAAPVEIPAPVAPVEIPAPVAAVEVPAIEAAIPFDPAPFDMDSDYDGLAEPFVPPVHVDEEIVEQIPAPRSSGYTELLRNIDSEEMPDFGIDEEINPFASPDAAGSPLQFEELLAVTSKDGTAPLAPIFDGDAAPASALPDPLQELADPLEAFAWPSDEIVSAEPAPAPVAAVDAAPVEPALDDMLVGLDHLQPFSLDDGNADPADSHGAVDFSDINEAPFDPASLNGVMMAPAPSKPSTANGWHDTAPPAIQPATMPEEPAVASQSPVWHEIAPPQSADTSAAVAASAEPPPTPNRASTNGLGIGPGAVAWPAFVGQTSDLIDRGVPTENLFTRLRGSKKQGQAAGLYAISRSLRRSAPIDESRVHVMSMPAPAPAPAIQEAKRPARVSTLSESERIDLMSMRVRLIEDDSSAQEVATAIEAAIAGGMHDALALRVLGEAYLRLGRTEKAAAQFRQAMLMRQRARV